MALELRHLRLVQEVAREQSLTRAGKRLFLTQSALSHQLAAAEAHFGAQLFVRQGRRMVPTPAGERVLLAAARVLGEVASAEREVRQMTSGERATVRVSTECYTAYHWLPAVLRDFRARWPGVEVQVAAEATRRPVQVLLDGGLDLAIVYSAPDRPGLQTLPLFRDELVAVTAPDHPWCGRPYLSPQDFAGEHLIVYTTPEPASIITRFLEPAGISPRRVSEMQLTEGIAELVRAGLGVAVMARWALRPQIESGALAVHRLTPTGIYRDWHAVIPAGIPPRHLLDLVQMIAQHAAPAQEPSATAA
jgi:LysR family transcriptional regulator for metE and metH